MSYALAAPVRDAATRAVTKHLVWAAGAIGVVAATVFILDRYITDGERRYRRSSLLRKLAAGLAADKLRAFVANADPIALAMTILNDSPEDAEINQQLRAGLAVSL